AGLSGRQHRSADDAGLRQRSAKILERFTSISESKKVLLEKNYWGGHGIVGGQTPLGLEGLIGAALCFLGDGAVNQGCFYAQGDRASAQ
ncbi:MAG: hypothetical protein WCE49_19000, partial [Terrimicrobiaceae bacterium]